MKRLLNSIVAVACLTASLVNAQESAEAKLSFNPGHYKGWSLAVPPLSWNREAVNLNDNRFSYTVKAGDEECSFLISSLQYESGETYESKLRELTSGRDSRVLSQDKTIVGTKLLLEMFLPEDWKDRHTGDEIHGVVLTGTKYMWFAVICTIDPAKAKAIAVPVLKSIETSDQEEE